jgi:AcrR family transcriptional regulator
VAARKKASAKTRFSAEEARDAILAATEKRLLEVGPEGLRLQEIARDVGLSHPTVIHHFGSREGLVDAVANRAVMRLERDLLACFTELDPTTDPLELTLTTLDRVDDALRRHGHARLLAWLALTDLPGPKESLLRDIALAIHAARKADGESASLEDSLFRVLLVSAAMVGVGLLGTKYLPLVGLPSDEKVHARFRRWFATILADSLERRS